MEPHTSRHRDCCRLQQLQLLDPLHADFCRNATEPSGIQRLYRHPARGRHSHGRIAGHRPLVRLGWTHAHHAGRGGFISDYGLSGLPIGDALRSAVDIDRAGVLAQSRKTSYSGVLPSLMAEIFPTRTRSTGIALSYNISAPIFGGFASLISTWLIQISGNSLAPSFYLMLTALVSIGALLLVRSQLRLS
jgi:hypothetical protein